MVVSIVLALVLLVYIIYMLYTNNNNANKYSSNSKTVHKEFFDAVSVAQTVLETAIKKRDDDKIAYDNAQNKLTLANAKSNTVEPTLTTISSLKTTMDTRKTTMDNSKTTMDNANTTLSNATNDVSVAQTTYNKANNDYNTAKTNYDIAYTNYPVAQKQYDDATKAVADATADVKLKQDAADILPNGWLKFGALISLGLAKDKLTSANTAVANAPTLEAVNNLKKIADISKLTAPTATAVANLLTSNNDAQTILNNKLSAKTTAQTAYTNSQTAYTNAQTAYNTAKTEYDTKKSTYDTTTQVDINAAQREVDSAPSLQQLTIDEQKITIAKLALDKEIQNSLIKTTQPATTQPATTQPATTQPASTKPATTKPATTQPATTQPETTKPATTQPETTQPATTQPEPIQEPIQAPIGTTLKYNTGIANILGQGNLINNLTTTIDKLKNSLIITENFDNIGSSSVILTPNAMQELNSYTDSYNNSIALLDDPNQLNKAAFDTYIYLQEKKLSNLQNDFNKLKTTMDENRHAPTPIKGLKSMQNSNILNVETYPNPNIIQPQIPGVSKPTTSYSGNGAIPSNYPNYLIYGNNGCLQFKKGDNTKTPIESSSFDFQSCNANSNLQQFKINKINNKIDYNSPISQTNSNYKLNDDSSTQFGFYVVNPMTDSKQCLQLNNDGLSIVPCTMETSQRFKPTYHSVLD